jgi:cytoskeletal protein CcmA (bactofilin family)
MFGKGKDGTETDRPQTQPQSQQQTPRSNTTPVVTHVAAHESSDAVSIISSDMTVGRVEGELRASTVLISDGAEVKGDLIAEDLTIGGRVKGIIHANRVKLNSTAVVEGDIFHRSLAIEENARFEGSSKREESEAPRVPLSRPAATAASQTPTAAVNGNRAANGEGAHPTTS